MVLVWDTATGSVVWRPLKGDKKTDTVALADAKW